MLLSLIFLIPVVALSFAWLVLSRNKNEQFQFHRPPGPKGLPLIGNLYQFLHISEQPHILLAKLANIYGPIISFKLGFATVVVVQSATTAKEVLKTQDLNYSNRTPTVVTQKMNYHGLDIAFNPYNEYFREVKKLSVVHLLNSKRVQSFTPILNEEITCLLNKISSLSCASKAVNLSEMIMSFACSNICRMAFSKRYEDGPGNRFNNLLIETQALFTTFFFADYLPFMGWLDKICGKTSRLERVFKAWDAFYEELINDHLDPNRPKLEHEDFIDVLLHLQKQRSFTFEISFDHIKALLMNIIIAGTDTATAMIIWTITELIKNPMTMKKVQQELRNGTKKKDHHIIWEDLQNLEYFKAVVKETFRLHPAAPLLARHETIRKSKIQGYDISPKTVVYVSVWAIGRDPESWKDPEMFMPERFIGSSIDFKGQDFELIPFGSGRRMCPGYNLGIVMMELTLANLLHSFDWELPVGMNKEDVDMDTLPGLTMHKKNPLCLMAKKVTGTVIP